MAHSTLTSTALLRGLEDQRDVEAWQRFCERYGPLLLAVARRSGLRDADADDVVQDTLLVFVERYRDGQYERERGRLRSWLRGIALNKIREARRRLGKSPVQVTEDSRATGFFNRIPDEDEATAAFEQEWRRSVLDECMRIVRSEVEAHTFEAFRLYAMEQWPVGRVAEHLQVSENVVFIAKTRVVARLRKLQTEIAEIW